MKKKGVEFTISLIISMLVICSFAFSVCAADNSEYGYNDSHIDSNATQDHSLIFIPPPPASEFKNYLVAYSPGNEMYYMYVSDSYVSWFDILGREIVNGNGWYLYSSKITSNSWELIDQHRAWHFAQLPSDYQIFDATAPVSGHYGDQKMFVQKTGYRLYWDFIKIWRFILDWTLEVSDYIMQHTLIRYAMLLFLAGEVLVFAVVLIQKIGDIRSEEV